MIQEGVWESWNGNRTWYDKKLKARVLLCCSFFKSTGEGKKHVKKIEHGPHLCVIGWATLGSNIAGRPKVSYLSEMRRKTG